MSYRYLTVSDIGGPFRFFWIVMFAGEDVAKGQDERSKDCEEQASFAKGRVRYSDGVSRWFEGNAQTASETLSAGQSQQKAKCMPESTQHRTWPGDWPSSSRTTALLSSLRIRFAKRTLPSTPELAITRRPRNGQAAARLDAGPASVSGWERLVDFSRCRPGHFKCPQNA